MKLDVKKIPPKIGHYFASFADGKGSFNISFRRCNDYKKCRGKFRCVLIFHNEMK